MIHSILCAADLLCCAAFMAPPWDTIAPAAPEMDEKARWVSAAFLGAPYSPSPRTGIEVVANHGPIDRNARGTLPLCLAGNTYRRGLSTHAPSRVVVRLPGPAARFDAIAGVDSNYMTSGGRGSVVFAVEAGGAEVWRSDLRTEASPVLTVDVPLDGATELTLSVEDGGDGISCDQASWADASVELQDGTRLWLDEMDVYDRTRAPYPTEAPFSFTYGGRPSREFLPGWSVERSSREITDERHGARTEHTLTYSDPGTGLVVSCVAVEYRDYPTVEWTLHFRNGGTADTPILSDIRAMDVSFDAGVVPEYVLHQIRGDDCSIDSYRPMTTPLQAGQTLPLANTGGRPTQVTFPYLNVAWPARGVLCVLGWPGQWNMELTRNAASGLRVTGGQEATHFVLHPGEEVRGPLSVLQFYDGDWMRAQNMWRRWMIAHNVPYAGGKRVETLRHICNGNYYPNLMTVAETELGFLKAHIDQGVDFDWWWQDAGWFPCDELGGWWQVGTWEPDPVRFPDGIRGLSDVMHEHGKKVIVWFEPERVAAPSWLAENHPEWIHGGAAGGLLDLGNLECRRWLIDHIDALMREQGIDAYRQDFNMDPLPYWREADSPDRQGITEIRHIEGYLAYWDELLSRDPNRFIDSCASGGRRNDLETMRRSVPLLRSDWYHSPEGQQCLTYGLAQWLPYQGTGIGDPQLSLYFGRSAMLPSFNTGPWGPGIEGVDWDLVRKLISEHRRVSEYMLGDFHPLTPYTQALDGWMVFQWDRPDLGGGVIQAFRRPGSIYESARLKLRNLDPDATYTLTDLDTAAETRLTGEALMNEGALVVAPDAPSAVVIEYAR